MKVIGIVAEYNPFHKGHLYHIEEAKRLTGADKVIAVMSGDYMQRGIPAIIDKYQRTKMALQNGIDLCIELPFCYATASAELFVSAAVAILDKLGVVEGICFGSECGDIKVLEDIADILIDEPKEYQETLRDFLKCGRSYPAARSEALSGYFEDFPEYRKVLLSPNNILGIEYIKALKKRNSKIQPYTSKRLGADYHDKQFPSDCSYASAISIRTSLHEANDLSLIREQLPQSVYQLLEPEFRKSFPIYCTDFSSLLHYKLLLENDKDYTKYADVSQSLSDRIQKKLSRYSDYPSFCEALKTKDITYARVSRALLHILMNTLETDCEYYRNHDYADYARILGFCSSSVDLLSEIKKKASLTLLAKPADAGHWLSPFGLSIFEEGMNASQIYNSIVSEKYHQKTQNEYTRQIIKV